MSDPARPIGAILCGGEARRLGQQSMSLRLAASDRARANDHGSGQSAPRAEHPNSKSAHGRSLGVAGTGHVGELGGLERGAGTFPNPSRDHNENHNLTASICRQIEATVYAPRSSVCMYSSMPDSYIALSQG